LKRNHLHRLLLLFSRFLRKPKITFLFWHQLPWQRLVLVLLVTMIILFDYGLFRGEMCVVLCLGISVSLKKRDW
jgi:hypothetical protein